MDDMMLPPQPSAMPAPKPVVEGIPVIVYINGKPVEMSKQEALSVMAQIANILMYLEENKTEE